MKETRTKEQIRADQVKIAEEIVPLGWSWLCSWIFMSPSGTYHDLSAADISKIELIEREGLFLSEIRIQ